MLFSRIYHPKDLIIIHDSILAAIDEMGDNINTDFDTIIGSSLEEAKELIAKLDGLITNLLTS